MLATAVWASCNVQLQVLIEAGQTLFQFLHKPTRKALRFGDRKFAELRTTASDSPARKRRTVHRESDCVQLLREIVGIDSGDVYDQQILHAGCAKFTASKPL